MEPRLTITHEIDPRPTPQHGAKVRAIHPT
jgi:hypothetical protein